MRTACLTFSLFCGLLPLAAFAETIACPDLGSAVQVGACPSEEELRYTYMGYCGDNARMYGGDQDDVCSNFDNYRKLKNVVLWESADGNFSGYVSCDLPPAQLKATQPATLSVARQGSITRLVCGYGPGIVFSHRTKQACRPLGDGSCAADPAGCRASCQ